MSVDPQSIRSDFYVYALCRGDTGMPFYIGKGHGDRWDHHERQARAGAKGHKYAIIRQTQVRGARVIKVKLHEWLTEAVAHEYEVALIKAIGRGSDGPLVNLTDGGDGITGFRFPPGKKLSPEHITKRSAARRGKKLSAEARANIGAGQRGRQKSPEECANIAAALRGKKRSPESVAKQAATLRGRKHSAETCARVSAAHRNSDAVMEHIAKLAEANRGAKRSPEARANISAGRRAARERRRAEASA